MRTVTRAATAAHNSVNRTISMARKMVLFMWALGSITVTSLWARRRKILMSSPSGSGPGSTKTTVLGIGRAQGAVEGVEIMAFPGNAALAHPFAACDGLGGLSEIAARLDGHDKPVQDFRCCRVFAWSSWGSLVIGGVKNSRAFVVDWTGMDDCRFVRGRQRVEAAPLGADFDEGKDGARR